MSRKLEVGETPKQFIEIRLRRHVRKSREMTGFEESYENLILRDQYYLTCDNADRRKAEWKTES